MNRLNINNLGRYVSGWAQLIEGEADKAGAVREQLSQHLKERNMPAVAMTMVQGFVNSPEADRPYLITTQKAGYTSAIMVRDHGKDLYVSWKTFQRPVANRTYILAFIGIVAPLLSAIIAGRDLLGWVISFVIWLTATVVIGGGALVLVYKGLRQEIPIPNVSLEVRKGLNVALAIAGPLLALFILTQVISPPRFPGIASDFWVVYLAIVTLGVGVSFLRGILTAGHPLAYLFRMPTVFDVDDAVAMSRSVHKSLVHSLDQVGVDTSRLRFHDETIQGQIGESL